MTKKTDSLTLWSFHNAIAVASLGIKVTERKASGVNLVAPERATQLVNAYPGKVTTQATTSHPSTKSVTQFFQALEPATTLTV